MTSDWGQAETQPDVPEASENYPADEAPGNSETIVPRPPGLVEAKLQELELTR